MPISTKFNLNKMKKTFFVFFLAVIAIAVIAVQASAFGTLNIDMQSVDVKGIDAEVTPSVVISAAAGETIPVRVIFLANESATDARVEAEISGFRDDISSKTPRFNLISGTTYSKLLSLKLPTDVDPFEDLQLEITVFTKDKSWSKNYNLRLQRDSYVVDLLSVDADREVKAGENLAVSVVIKNRGFERLDDLFVTAVIPELGVQKRVYFEDLVSVDSSDEDDDKKDSEERTLYLKIPSSAKTGIYELQVTAYNADVEEKETQSISIVGGEEDSEVLAPVTVREVAEGETKEFELILVNKGNSLKVYEIVPETSDNLGVSVDNPIVVVPAGSSTSVKVQVTGNEKGTYNFGVNVKQGDQLVKRVSLTAKVTEGGVQGVNNLTVLTIVLVILFVVLLIVLIVLLARKPARKEEFEESYY